MPHLELGPDPEELQSTPATPALFYLLPTGSSWGSFKPRPLAYSFAGLFPKCSCRTLRCQPARWMSCNALGQSTAIPRAPSRVGQRHGTARAVAAGPPLAHGMRAARGATGRPGRPRDAGQGGPQGWSERQRHAPLPERITS